MAVSKTILNENREYWTGRAGGYSKVNQTELRTSQRETWREELRAHIARQFPDREAESIQADWMSDLVTYLENVLPVEK